MAAKEKEDIIDSSEDEADSFDNYGVFQSDYEFKFVQEGNEKTTLMLPPVTYDSMEVKYFNVEIEVDSDLFVSALERETTVNGTTRFFFRIAKPSEQLGQGDDGEIYEKLGEDGYDYGEMKNKATGKGKKQKGKKQKPGADMDAHNYSKPKGSQAKSGPVIKVESEEPQMLALDGTQIDKDDEKDNDDDNEEYDNEGEVDEEEEDYGDGDDDMDDIEEIEIGDDDDDYESSFKTPKRQKKKQPTSSGKKRKYDKTNFYSKESNNFTVEMTEEGNFSRQFKCNYCDYKTPISGNMRLHVLIHTGERPFSCDMCSSTFNRQATLKLHKNTVHAVERNEICEICGAGFKIKRQLQHHMKRHFGIKKYMCSICGKQMSNKTAMDEHINTHTKAKKYMCLECNKCVSSDSAMKRHMLLHTGGKNQCHICTKTFVRKEEWRKHLIKEHSYTGHEEILGKRHNQVKQVNISEEINE